jgi:hypothetical protein
VSALFALFNFILTFFHFYGPSIYPRSSIHLELPNQKLSKNWSIIGKSDLEGVTDFTKREV